MAKKPVKEAIREKLSIPEQPKSKGELVPVKPKAPASRVPSVGKLTGIFGKFARGAARRSPLLEIILQNLPGKEEVSENIKRHMDNLLQEKQTRREFIKKMLKRTAKAGAAALVDKRALLEAILQAGEAAPAAIVPEISIEEQILQALQEARGNAPLRREIISKAVKDLGLEVESQPIYEDSGDPVGTEHGTAVTQIGEFPLEAEAVSDHLDEHFGLDQFLFEEGRDFVEDPTELPEHMRPGTNELIDEISDDHQTVFEIDQQNRVETGSTPTQRQQFEELLQRERAGIVSPHIDKDGREKLLQHEAIPAIPPDRELELEQLAREKKSLAEANAVAQQLDVLNVDEHGEDIDPFVGPGTYELLDEVQSFHNAQNRESTLRRQLEESHNEIAAEPKTKALAKHLKKTTVSRSKWPNQTMDSELDPIDDDEIPF